VTGAMNALPGSLIRLLVLVAALFWCAGPLQAQDGSISDSEEALKAEVQALLDSFVAGTRYWQGVPITFDFNINGIGPNIDLRDPSIENLRIKHIDGGRFQARFSDIMVRTVEGAPVTLGSVQFDLLRLGDGRYAVEDFYFTAPFWIADAGGVLDAQVTFVNPALTGVYSTSINSFELFDFRADRFVVVPARNAREMVVNDPRVLREVRRIESSGRYDAFTSFESGDVSIKGDSGGRRDSRLHLDSFAVELDLKNADLDGIDATAQ